MSDVSLSLPNFDCTEEAVRYGQFITRDQFIMIAGARAALEREFKETPPLTQYKADVAFRIQMLRECLDAAPVFVFASLICSGLNSSASTLHPFIALTTPHMAPSGV